MPAHTRLPYAVMNELWKVPAMQAASQGYDLSRLTVDEWPRDAVQVLVRELDVLNESGLGFLLQADAAACGTEVRRSTIAGAGLGVFATREFTVGERLLPFYGQLVYHDLQVPARSGSARLATKRYGAGALPMRIATTAERWQTCALQLRTATSLWSVTSSSRAAASMVPSAVSAVVDRATAQSRVPVWVVPSECCAAGKVNDPHPHPVANTSFEQRIDPVCARKDLIKSWCGRLRVTADIQAGEEVTVPYGRLHPLHVSEGGPVGGE